MSFEWWHWIVLGIGLVIAELAVPAFFVIWFGLGALLVGLALLAALSQAAATGAEPPAGPTAKDLVELPAGRVYELLAQHDRETVWIPIERPGRDGVEDLLLSSQPHDVAVGTRHDLSLVEAFSATLRASHRQALAERGQHAQPQHVELEETQHVHVVFVPGYDGAPRHGGGLHRSHLAQRRGDRRCHRHGE